MREYFDYLIASNPRVRVQAKVKFMFSFFRSDKLEVNIKRLREAESLKTIKLILVVIT